VPVLRVQVQQQQPGRLEMERSGQDGDEGRGRGRVVGAADVQQDQLQPGSDLQGNMISHGERLQEGPITGDAVENPASGSAPGASSVPNNNSSAPARGQAARVVRERAAELVMEKVWLPSCEGRECIEFVAGLPDLSGEHFEV
jgi:hypothetical protein